MYRLPRTTLYPVPTEAHQAEELSASLQLHNFFELNVLPIQFLVPSRLATDVRFLPCPQPPMVTSFLVSPTQALPDPTKSSLGILILRREHRGRHSKHYTDKQRELSSRATGGVLLRGVTQRNNKHLSVTD